MCSRPRALPGAAWLPTAPEGGEGEATGEGEPAASGGRVVVDDAPAAGEAAEDEGEQAAGIVLLQGQLPAAAHQGVVGAEQLDVQLAEGELAHLAALALVLFAVAVERGLPAARFG